MIQAIKLNCYTYRFDEIVNRIRSSAFNPIMGKTGAGPTTGGTKWMWNGWISIEFRKQQQQRRQRKKECIVSLETFVFAPHDGGGGAGHHQFMLSKFTLFNDPNSFKANLLVFAAKLIPCVTCLCSSKINRNPVVLQWFEATTTATATATKRLPILPHSRPLPPHIVYA